MNQFLGFFIWSKIAGKDFIADYRDEYETYVLMKATKGKIVYIFLRKLLTLMFRQSEIVTTVTPALGKELKKRGIPNVRIIPDGVDVQTFRPMDKEEVRSAFGLSMKDFVIVYSGSIYSPYRLDVAIKAFEKLVKTKVKKGIFLIIGGGNVSGILELAKNLGIAENVRHLGLIHNPIDVVKIICCGDIGIIPYNDSPLWKKTYSTKFFEYCACGLPVIATVHQDSILATLIEMNGIGLITPPLDHGELATALGRLYLDPQLRLKMSQKAANFVKTKYDKVKIAEDLLAILNKRSRM